jgi:hypothetical protein
VSVESDVCSQFAYSILALDMDSIEAICEPESLSNLRKHSPEKKRGKQTGARQRK